MRSGIEALLSELRENRDVALVSPSGIPQVESPATLPGDVRRFYEVCGGATLFPNSEYPVRLLGPDQFVQTNRILWKEVFEEALKSLVQLQEHGQVLIQRRNIHPAVVTTVDHHSFSHR